MRVAGLGELGGLGDVFSSDEFGREGGIELEGFECALGGEAVGRVERVGDGDFGDPGTGEGVERERLRGGVLARPEDEYTAGVGDGVALGGERGGDELLGVDVVGGEEEVLRVAVLELLGEGGGGAEAGDDVDAGELFVVCGEGGQDGSEVGCGGDVEGFGLGETEGGGEEGEGEGEGEDSAYPTHRR